MIALTVSRLDKAMKEAQCLAEFRCISAEQLKSWFATGLPGHMAGEEPPPEK